MTDGRKLAHLIILGGLAYSLAANGATPVSTGIFRASGAFAVIDVNGDGVLNYSSLPPDEVFYYPVAADQTTTGDVPVVGDWNGDGRSKIGVFRHDGAWFLDANGDGVLDSGDLIFQYTATPGDIPVVGDWNGDGRTKTGIFRNGQWILDVNGDGVVDFGALGVDRVFQYTATPGDVPIVGDWNADGRTKTGVFRSGAWILDVDGDGVIEGADEVYQYTATAGDVPILGDWNADGRTKTGIFRSGEWILDVNGDGVIDGSEHWFQYTATAGDVPIVGDWNGDGHTKTGIFRSGEWILDFNGDGVITSADLVFQYTATAGDVPIVGAWALSTSVTVTTTVPGLQVTIDSGMYITPTTFNWIVSAPHTIAISSLPQGDNSTRYVFSEWSDAGQPSHSITVGATPTTYTAVMTTQYAYSRPDPGNGNTLIPLSGWYNAGSVLSVQAGPNTGQDWVFSGFSGAVAGMTNPQYLTLNAPSSVTASFFQNNPAITTVALPGGTIGVPYSSTLSAIGGNGQYRFGIANGSGLTPPGITLLPSGVFTGTPTQQGPYSFAVYPTDGNQVTGSEIEFGITIAPSSQVQIVTSALASGAAGTPYSQALFAAGGTQPYTWSFVSGNPSWLSISSNSLTATNPVQGSYLLTLQVTDNGSHSSNQKQLTLAIAAGTNPLIITTSSTLSNGIAESAYSVPINVTGGTGSYTWSVSGGALPPGVNLSSSTGLLSGIPTAPNTYPFSILVTDTANHIASQSFTTTIAPSSPLPVSATPGNLTVAPGLPATYMVKVNSNAGFNGTVGFVTTALPSGYTAAFNPTTLSSAGTTTLTITPPLGSSSGMIPVQVSASSGSVSLSTVVFLTVAPASPASMLSPAVNGMLTSGQSTTFRWNAGLGATQYQLNLGTTAGASDVISTNTGMGQSLILDLPPCENPMLYATLSSYINGVWQSGSYEYPECGCANAPPPPPPPPPIPVPAFRIYGSSEPYTLDDGQPRVGTYQMYNASNPTQTLFSSLIDSDSLQISGLNVSANISTVHDISLFDVTFTAGSAPTGQRDLNLTWKGIPAILTGAAKIDDATPVIYPPIQQFPPSSPDGSFNIALSGTNFGQAPGSVAVCAPTTNPTTGPCITTQDVTVSPSYPYWSDTQVSVQLTPSPSPTASGLYYIQLTSGGESPGQGFVQAPQGTSAQSNFVQVQVQPAVTISGGPGIPLNGTNTFSVQVSPAGNTVPITLAIATSGGTSGSAQFVGSGTSMTITGSIAVTIQGTGVSSTANNITLTALLPATASSPAVTLASAPFSVVSVTITMNAKPPLAGDDAAAEFYLSGPANLGAGAYFMPPPRPGQPQSCNVGVEFAGAVKPSNYPGPVTLRRQFAAISPPNAIYTGGNVLGGYHDVANGDDTSSHNLLATTPSTQGNVYDIDAPGTSLSSDQVPQRYRANFIEYAVLGNFAGDSPPPNPVPSIVASFSWWAAVSCTQDQDGNLLLATDVPGDNQAGQGTTKITWNLQ